MCYTIALVSKDIKYSCLYNLLIRSCPRNDCNQSSKVLKFWEQSPKAFYLAIKMSNIITLLKQHSMCLWALASKAKYSQVWGSHIQCEHALLTPLPTIALSENEHKPGQLENPSSHRITWSNIAEGSVFQHKIIIFLSHVVTYHVHISHDPLVSHVETTFWHM